MRARMAQFSEDPFVVGVLSTAAVKGLQGADGGGGANTYLGSPSTKIISQAKHCCAYDYGGRDGRRRCLMSVLFLRCTSAPGNAQSQRLGYEVPWQVTTA